MPNPEEPFERGPGKVPCRSPRTCGTNPVYKGTAVVKGLTPGKVRWLHSWALSGRLAGWLAGWRG